MHRNPSFLMALGLVLLLTTWNKQSGFTEPTLLILQHASVFSSCENNMTLLFSLTVCSQHLIQAELFPPLEWWRWCNEPLFFLAGVEFVTALTLGNTAQQKREQKLAKMLAYMFCILRVWKKIPSSAVKRCQRCRSLENGKRKPTKSQQSEAC